MGEPSVYEFINKKIINIIKTIFHLNKLSFKAKWPVIVTVLNYHLNNS